MKKLIALVVTGIMLLSPFTAFADDDLEARVAALEEKVADLEAQLAGSVPEGVTAAPVQEVADVGEVETGIVSNNCSLEYVDFEVSKTYDDFDCVIVYFDFINGSGETSQAADEFRVDVFQNGVEQEFGTVSDNQADKDWYTKVRSGSDALRVAYTSKIGDMSDIIVSLRSSSDYNMDPVEFTLALE